MSAEQDTKFKKKTTETRPLQHCLQTHT